MNLVLAQPSPMPLGVLANLIRCPVGMDGWKTIHLQEYYLEVTGGLRTASMKFSAHH